MPPAAVFPPIPSAPSSSSSLFGPLSLRSPAALLLPPTLLAASSVTFAVTESLFLRALLSAPPDVAGNALFQDLWTAFLPPGIGMAVLTNGGAALLGLRAWWALPRDSWARGLAGWGSLAAGAHFLWVGPIATVIERMINHPVDSREDVRSWLRLHRIRGLVSETVSLGLFVSAWFL